jgi:hypothetical protein
MPDVTAKIKPLRPKLPRKIAAPLKVEPRSNRYMLVGTAFDYLLRFELQRLAPHAVAERWVAEYAPDIIWRRTETGAVGLDVFFDADPDNYMPPEEVAERARRIVTEAKAAVAAYVKSKTPNRAKQTDLAAYAIRLAKLDSVHRAWRLDPWFEEADPEDVQDLLDMLAIVPFDVLLHKEVLLLNPTFKDSSLLVGGADTDLIAGDLLVDFKTTKRSEMQVGDLDQLLGYYLLARNQRRTDPTFPPINRLGLYYCRHGYLWSMDAAVWMNHPQFPDVEEWFFRRAKEVFDSSRVPDTTSNRK